MPRSELLKGFLPETILKAASSGSSVPDERVAPLEARWTAHLQALDHSIADHSDIENALHDELLANYYRAGKETGYWGNYFLRELRKKGGLLTAKRMLKPAPTAAVTPGLQALIDAGRTDLSLEATALKPGYRPLFTAAELAEAQRRLDRLPSFVVRRPVSPESNFPEELAHATDFTEGAQRKVTVNAYERNPSARAACLAKHGTRRAACGMRFEERYGPIGKGFIHVHHKKPLAARRGQYKLNPHKDLVPVCPNCHAMLHTQDPPLGIDELKEMLLQHQAHEETAPLTK